MRGDRVNMAGVGKLLKQAAKMQKQLEAVQAEMAEQTLDVTSGGGAVKVTITLNQEIQSIELDPEFLREETAVVEEAITEAVREAIAQSKKMNDEAVQKITQSLQVPGMPSLF